MTKRYAPSLCDRHGHTYHCVCVGQRITQWSPSSSYLLSWASGLKLGLQACMAKCPYPLSHLTPPRVLFWYRVSLCSYKLSALSWNWQVSFLSAPNAGIRDEDHFSWWKLFLYSTSDIKIMCFSPTNNQYFNGCPTIWSQYCSCQKSLGDNTQTPVKSECVPTTLSSPLSQSLTANQRSQVPILLSHLATQWWSSQHFCVRHQFLLPSVLLVISGLSQRTWLSMQMRRQVQICGEHNKSLRNKNVWECS